MKRMTRSQRKKSQATPKKKGSVQLKTQPKPLKKKENQNKNKLITKNETHALEPSPSVSQESMYGDNNADSQQSVFIHDWTNFEPNELVWKMGHFYLKR